MVLLLAACGDKTPPQIVVPQTKIAQLDIPAGLDRCKSEPVVPSRKEDGSRDSEAVAKYVVALAKWGTDCKTKHAGLVKVINNHNKATIQ